MYIRKLMSPKDLWGENVAKRLDWNQIHRKSMKFLREIHFFKLQQALIDIVKDEKCSLGPQLSTTVKKY